ncbi:unnamed protein product [Cuscuta epithymum]|uniref:Uncharacterized protein n=1 Tax=Cuscuta epithymum TaxID=186058 RepID=A0AAV0FV92_9ASTE|nr:unnamed protein product [Cuscuta epithymum]
MSEIEKLVEQRELGEISIIDEEIFESVKPKGKCGSDRGKWVSPSITSLYGPFREGEKLRKEAEEAKKEAYEAKKEASEANEKNKTLTKELNSFKNEVRVMKGVMEKFFNLMGGDFSKLIANEVHKENNQEKSDDGDDDEDDHGDDGEEEEEEEE